MLMVEGTPVRWGEIGTVPEIARSRRKLRGGETDTH